MRHENCPMCGSPIERPTPRAVLWGPLRLSVATTLRCWGLGVFLLETISWRGPRSVVSVRFGPFHVQARAR